MTQSEILQIAGFDDTPEGRAAFMEAFPDENSFYAAYGMQMAYGGIPRMAPGGTDPTVIPDVGDIEANTRVPGLNMETGYHYLKPGQQPYDANYFISKGYTPMQPGSTDYYLPGYNANTPNAKTFNYKPSYGNPPAAPGKTSKPSYGYQWQDPKIQENMAIVRKYPSYAEWAAAAPQKDQAILGKISAYNTANAPVPPVTPPVQQTQGVEQFVQRRQGGSVFPQIQSADGFFSMGYENVPGPYQGGSFKYGGIPKYQNAGNAPPPRKSIYDQAIEKMQYDIAHPETWKGDPDMTNPDGSYKFCVDCINVDYTNKADVDDVTRLIKEGKTAGPHYGLDAYNKALQSFGDPTASVKRYGGYLPQAQLGLGKAMLSAAELAKLAKKVKAGTATQAEATAFLANNLKAAQRLKKYTAASSKSTNALNRQKEFNKEVNYITKNIKPLDRSFLNPGNGPISMPFMTKHFPGVTAGSVFDAAALGTGLGAAGAYYTNDQASPQQQLVSKTPGQWVKNPDGTWSLQPAVQRLGGSPGEVFHAAAPFPSNGDEAYGMPTYGSQFIAKMGGTMTCGCGGKMGKGGTCMRCGGSKMQDGGSNIPSMYGELPMYNYGSDYEYAYGGGLPLAQTGLIGKGLKGMKTEAQLTKLAKKVKAGTATQAEAAEFMAHKLEALGKMKKAAKVGESGQSKIAAVTTDMVDRGKALLAASKNYKLPIGMGLGAAGTGLGYYALSGNTQVDPRVIPPYPYPVGQQSVVPTPAVAPYVYTGNEPEWYKNASGSYTQRAEGGASEFNEGEEALPNQMKQFLTSITKISKAANDKKMIEQQMMSNEFGMPTAAKGGWIQDANASIKRRGTKGVCTGAKFGSKSCPPGSRRYNLAKTFKKMAKKEAGGSVESMSEQEWMHYILRDPDGQKLAMDHGYQDPQEFLAAYPNPDAYIQEEEQAQAQIQADQYGVEDEATEGAVATTDEDAEGYTAYGNINQARWGGMRKYQPGGSEDGLKPDALGKISMYQNAYDQSKGDMSGSFNTMAGGFGQALSMMKSDQDAADKAAAEENQKISTAIDPYNQVNTMNELFGPVSEEQKRAFIMKDQSTDPYFARRFGGALPRAQEGNLGEPDYSTIGQKYGDTPPSYQSVSDVYLSNFGADPNVVNYASTSKAYIPKQVKRASYKTGFKTLDNLYSDYEKTKSEAAKFEKAKMIVDILGSEFEGDVVAADAGRVGFGMTKFEDPKLNIYSDLREFVNTYKESKKAAYLKKLKNMQDYVLKQGEGLLPTERKLKGIPTAFSKLTQEILRVQEEDAQEAYRNPWEKAPVAAVATPPTSAGQSKIWFNPTHNRIEYIATGQQYSHPKKAYGGSTELHKYQLKGQVTEEEYQRTVADSIAANSGIPQVNPGATTSNNYEWSNPGGFTNTGALPTPGTINYGTIATARATADAYIEGVRKAKEQVEKQTKKDKVPTSTNTNPAVPAATPTATGTDDWKTKYDAEVAARTALQQRLEALEKGTSSTSTTNNQVAGVPGVYGAFPYRQKTKIKVYGDVYGSPYGQMSTINPKFFDAKYQDKMVDLYKNMGFDYSFEAKNGLLGRMLGLPPRKIKTHLKTMGITAASDKRDKQIAKQNPQPPMTLTEQAEQARIQKGIADGSIIDGNDPNSPGGPYGNTTIKEYLDNKLGPYVPSNKIRNYPATPVQPGDYDPNAPISVDPNDTGMYGYGGMYAYGGMPLDQYQLKGEVLDQLGPGYTTGGFEDPNYRPEGSPFGPLDTDNPSMAAMDRKDKYRREKPWGEPLTVGTIGALGVANNAIASLKTPENLDKLESNFSAPNLFAEKQRREHGQWDINTGADYPADKSHGIFAGAKFGGSKYKVGGTYKMSKDEIDDLIKKGFKIKYV